ncbi:MAG: hypothetical protein KGJ90_00465 [Patescibacteria group bacterium]|nr:hypothetical protein [Patescibacteria group bacterium]
MSAPIDIYTNLNPEQLSAVGIEIYRMWVAFALGAMSINGRRLISPTGKYASSIQFKKIGIAHVAVIADEDEAPEGKYIEEGHGPIDQMQTLTKGRSYPLGRAAGAPYLSFNPNAKAIWGTIRHGTYRGLKRVPMERKAGKRNTSNTGPEWWIPAMIKYEPAHHLANLIRNAYGRR